MPDPAMAHPHTPQSALSQNPTPPDSPSKNLRSCSDKRAQQSPSTVLVSPVKKQGKQTENTMDAEVWNKDDDEIIDMLTNTSKWLIQH